MSDIVVYPRTGGPVHLNTLANVADIAWTLGGNDKTPAGPQSLSWRMDLSVKHTPSALSSRPLVELWEGPVRRWKGVLAEPTRGEPWELHAFGLSSLAYNFLCFDAGGATTSVPNTAIDQAIARGLPWKRYDSISAVPFSSATTTVALNKLGVLLDAYCAANGLRWGVGADGALFTRPLSSSPKWLLTRGVMGVADDNYLSHLYGRYVTTVSGTPPAPSAWATTPPAADADAATRWGRVEDAVDLTPLGVLNSGTAAAITQGRFNGAGARMGWTNPVDATYGELTNLDGTPARLSRVKDGDGLRIFGVLDAMGNLRIGASADVTIGEVAISEDDNTLVMSPVGLVDRDFESVTAAPSPPEEEFTG